MKKLLGIQVLGLKKCNNFIASSTHLAEGFSESCEMDMFHNGRYEQQHIKPSSSITFYSIITAMIVSYLN